MTTISATEARKLLYKLLDEVSASHEPVHITGRRGNAVLTGEEDWRAVQETLYLVSMPGMRESIIEGNRAAGEPLHVIYFVRDRLRLSAIDGALDLEAVLLPVVGRPKATPDSLGQGAFATAAADHLTHW